MIVDTASREQSRARYPDEEGYVERDGVRVFWEAYGDAPTTFLLFPTSPISHSRLWKAQIPYLSRHFRVVVFDPRGNGRSDRPTTADAYAWWDCARDGRAVLEASGAREAVFGGLCDGAGYALMLAATDPAAVLGVAAIAPYLPMLTPPHPSGAQLSLDDARRDYRSFLERFFAGRFPEPHSTKHVEDSVAWALEGGAETIALASWEAPKPWASEDEARDLCRRVRCPVLVIHGDLDICQTRARAEAVAELTSATFVKLEGAGHLPQARHPVKINTLMRQFGEAVAPQRSFQPLASRRQT